MAQIEVKKKQIEIAFDGVNQKFIKEMLLDIVDAGKKKLRKNDRRGSSYIALTYDDVQIDTFNAICERFAQTPEYKSYSKCWNVHIVLNANDADIFTQVAVMINSEKQVLEFQYDNKTKLK